MATILREILEYNKSQTAAGKAVCDLLAKVNK